MLTPFITIRYGVAAILLACADSNAAAASTPPDTMAQRMKACVVCHGKEGRATNHGFSPRIAGKPSTYLYNQLVNFRDGKRHNATMANLVGHLSDAYLREIADYFASQDLPYPSPQMTNALPRTLARGEQLVRLGDSERGIPACSSCHGEAMTGVAPSMPGLLGLPRDYILAQFGAWRSGFRRAATPDCMGKIARSLAPEDVTAMAVWLSSQRVRDGIAPANGGRPQQWPLECGSGTE
jgi:cytochrome c553